MLRLKPIRHTKNHRQTKSSRESALFIDCAGNCSGNLQGSSFSQSISQSTPDINHLHYKNTYSEGRGIPLILKFENVITGDLIASHLHQNWLDRNAIQSPLQRRSVLEVCLATYPVDPGGVARPP